MIYLGTPTGGRLDHHTVQSAFRDRNLYAKWDIVPSPYVHMNRNAIWHNWLRYGGEHLVMVDDDVSWGRDVLNTIERALIDNPVVFVDLPERQMGTTAYNWGANDLEEAPFCDKPFRCDAFGSCMFGVTRVFAQSLPLHPFDLRYFNGFQRREDLSFSLLIGEYGVRPCCLPMLDVTHHNHGKLRPRLGWYEELV